MDWDKRIVSNYKPKERMAVCLHLSSERIFFFASNTWSVYLKYSFLANATFVKEETEDLLQPGCFKQSVGFHTYSTVLN